MDKSTLLLLYFFVIGALLKESAGFLPVYEKPENNYKVPLRELCSFNVLEWKDLVPRDDDTPCNLHGEFGNYVPAACVPRGIEKIDKRVFVSTPRRPGVPSTLSYFNIDEIVNGKCPKLTSYPSFEANQLANEKCGDYINRIISVQGFSVDQCASERKLWLFDTGAVDMREGPKRIKDPSLFIISTKTDKIVRRRVLPRKFYIDEYVLGFSNVIVNVVSDDCENAYAYIVNHLAGTLTVYSYKEDLFWQFFSTLFLLNAYPDSLFEVKTLNNTAVQYQLHANIWDVSVDKYKSLLLFGARSSKHAFTIPLCTVHNRTASNLPREKYGISYLGKYNDRGQVAGFELIPETQTVFGIQEQNYALFCWDYQKKLEPTSVKLVAGCRQLVPFLVDIKVDRSYNDLNIILLSNNLPGIVFDDFYDIKNFRIYSVNVKEALAAYPECTSYKPVYNVMPYPAAPVYAQPPYSQNLGYYPPSVSYVANPAPCPYKATTEAPKPVSYVPPASYNPSSQVVYQKYPF